MEVGPIAENILIGVFLGILIFLLGRRRIFGNAAAACHGVFAAFGIAGWLVWIGVQTAESGIVLLLISAVAFFPGYSFGRSDFEGSKRPKVTAAAVGIFWSLFLPGLLMLAAVGRKNLFWADRLEYFLVILASALVIAVTAWCFGAKRPLWRTWLLGSLVFFLTVVATEISLLLSIFVNLAGVWAVFKTSGLRVRMAFLLTFLSWFATIGISAGGLDVALRLEPLFSAEEPFAMGEIWPLWVGLIFGVIGMAFGWRFSRKHLIGRSKVRKGGAIFATVLLLAGTAVGIPYTVRSIYSFYETSPPPAGKLSYTRSSDQEALRRTEGIFELADRIANKNVGRAPDTAIQIDENLIQNAWNTPEDTALLADAVLHSDTVRRLFRETAGYGPLAYPVPDEIGPSTRLPKLFGIIMLSRTVLLDARHKLYSGDYDGAAQDIAYVLDFGTRLRESRGFLINYLVATAIINMGAGSAELWLAETESKTSNPTALLAAVEKILEKDSGFRAAMAIENEYGKGALRGFAKASDGERSSFFGPSNQEWVPNDAAMLFFDTHYYLKEAEDFFSKMADLQEKPYYKVKDEIDDLEKDSTRSAMFRSLFRDSTRKLIPKILLSIALPKFQSILDESAKAKTRLTALHVALLLRNAQHSEVPLDDLHLPVSPYTGKPFTLTDTAVFYNLPGTGETSPKTHEIVWNP